MMINERKHRLETKWNATLRRRWICMMDIRRRRKFVRRFVSDGGSGRRMICGRRNMNMKAFLVVEEM
jgi:hypothetical protein